VRAKDVVGVARALQTLQLFVQAADDENAVRQERRNDVPVRRAMASFGGVALQLEAILTSMRRLLEMTPVEVARDITGRTAAPRFP
jgi:hypothetical protein